jgi:hypothetical protein
MLLLLAIGCRTSEPLGQTLYSDAEIVALHAKFTSTNSWLEVVPSGQTKKMNHIFRELGIDPERLSKPKTGDANMVRFYIWHVSPGYDLSVMTARNDPRNNFSHPMGLNGYGVRILRRSEYER